LIIRNLGVRAVRSRFEATSGRGLQTGFTTQRPHDKDLGLLREAHVEFLPRYPTIEAKPVFIIDRFERAVVKLLCAVGISMRGKNYRLHVDC
jgi:hypothetical protein